MATLGQLYSTKESNITVKKTHMVPLSSIYIEEGFNVRDIDWQHVNEFKDAFIAGEYIPPLFVEVTEKGVKVIDGHHRFLGAIEATKAGNEVARLECKDFNGSEADKIAFMITSSQGKQLSPLERANAYHRLINQGFTKEEIAKKVKRSIADVTNHLALADCEQPVKDMIKAGKIGYSTVLEIQKEHGLKASEVVTGLVNEAKSQGKKKASIKKFNFKKSHHLMYSEISSAIEMLNGHVNNCEQTNNTTELLIKIKTKLEQTMQIVRSEVWVTRDGNKSDDLNNVS